ncbi:MAG: hypothetical protein ISN26_03390 [Betaproteobacteria bacterium AqS2]|uniref:Glycosyltransferase RgtA/B/C/D-like domain-containing protein n=1 Tax=Candidatus Amphirhobacter heronislandensis TaxID=1732024 RepID=A0A930Y2P5_9GAMM|nr:hypothetical protein [Betaproteobacteria bacterium AqS2]
MDAGLLDPGDGRGAPVRPAGARAAYAPSRQLLLVLLCLLWFFPGVVGRGLWKPTETLMVPLAAESFAAGWNPVPALRGVPQLAEAPLYLYLAERGGAAFDFVLAPHEGMRLTNLLWLVLGLLLVGWHSGRDDGSRAGWRAVLLTLGSFSLLLSARSVNPDLALLPLGAAALAGLRLTAEGQGRAGGLLLGAAGALGVWTVGAAALWYVALLAALPLAAPRAFPGWRHAHVLPLALTLLAWSLWWAVLAGRGLAGAYQGQLLAALHPLALIAGLQDVLLAALWAAWPALPFAVAAFLRWRHRGGSDPTLTLGLLGLAAGGGALALAGHGRETGVFLLLPAAALMAAPYLRGQSRGMARMLDWFAILVIGGGMIGLFWLSWLAQRLDAPAGIVAWLAGLGLADGDPSVPAVALAAVASCAWFALMLRIGRSSERATLNWMAGLTMAWLVFGALWMQPLDRAKSYETVAEQLRAAAGAEPGCLRAEGVGLENAALLAHLTGLDVRPEAGASCPWLLASPAAAAGREAAWRGRRPGDGPAEGFVLLPAE